MRTPLLPMPSRIKLTRLAALLALGLTAALAAPAGAGNLREMFKGIVAVGSDEYTSGSRTIGSVLIERMKIAGS